MSKEEMTNNEVKEILEEEFEERDDVKFQAVVTMAAALFNNQEAYEEIARQAGHFADIDIAVISRAFDLVNTIEDNI